MRLNNLIIILIKLLRGQGVPWDRIMENEFELLSDRGGHCGHLAETLLKKYCSYPELSRLPYRDLPVITRQQLAISVIISKQGFLTFKFL